MNFVTILLIGISLSMDAFAASVCKGLAMKKVNIKFALIIGLFFGGFQAIMPAIGWFLGSKFEKYITNFDHWIAFGLLLIIGGKMIYDAIKGEEEGEEETLYKLNYKELFLLAIATSIDALAVGISFAFLDVNLVFSVTIIGITTFVLSVLGVYIGHAFGHKYERWATLAGGIVLALIGIKIVLEHTGVMDFGIL